MLRTCAHATSTSLEVTVVSTQASETQDALEDVMVLRYPNVFDALNMQNALI